MALSLPVGLTPLEVAFVCEMEMITIIPRQRLATLKLLGVGSPKSRLVQLLHNSYQVAWLILLRNRERLLP